MTSTTPAVGTVFHSTATRRYTHDGRQGTHVRVTAWRIVDVTDGFITAETDGIVSETGRPPFAGYPVDTTLTVESYARRVATGEIVEVSR